MTTTPEALPLTAEELAAFCVRYETYEGKYGTQESVGRLLATIAAEKARADAACARERALISDRDGAHKGRMEWFEKATKLEVENATLSAKVVLCVEALKFYSDPFKYKEYGASVPDFYHDLEFNFTADEALRDLPQSAASLLTRLEKMEDHIAGSWPRRVPKGFGHIYGCRYCKARLVEGMSTEIVHTADCPTKAISTTLPGVG